MLKRLKQINRSLAIAGQSPTWNDTDKVWESKGWFEFGHDDDGIEETTSENYQTRFLHTTSSKMPAGDYLFSWHFCIGGLSSAADIRGRVRVDGNIMIEYNIEPVDGIYQNTPTISGRRILTLSGGEIDIEIQYKAFSPGGYAHCGNPKISLRWVRK